MKEKANSIHEQYKPQRHAFGDTLPTDEAIHFGEKLIIMHANERMIRQTIGDGMPHRLQNIRIGLYTRGCMTAQVNLEERTVSQGMLEFFGTGTLFQMNDASANLRVMEVIVDPTYLSELLGGNMPHFLRLHASSNYVSLDDEEQQHYREMMRLLLYLVASEGEESPVARSMAITLLRYTISLFNKHMEHYNRNITRQESIFHEFCRLVTLSHGRERRHAYYADRLNVSEHYLSLAVKHTSGITAKEWIDRVVMTEIKLLLVHSELTIVQIADRLAFPSDSFLCKFFRSRTGKSPLEFRRAYK